MEQGSQDWLDYRKKGIGSSDAPVIMGVSPWQTLHGLWEDKTGRAKNYDGNWATRRGNQMEPIARAHYELFTMRPMPPQLVQHYRFPWMRASLDGYNSIEQIVLEIKCPGKDDHQKAVDGLVPEKYFPQLQHQLFCSGAKRVDYFSFDGQDGVIVEVFPDLNYMADYLARAQAFWHGNVLGEREPELCNRDFKLIRSKGFREALDEWHAASCSNLEYADMLKKLILSRDELSGKVRARCGMYRIDVLRCEIKLEDFLV